MEQLNNLALLIETGKANEAVSLTKSLIEQNIPLNTILQLGLLKGMNAIGLKWKEGKAFIPEVLIAARALNASMVIITEKMPKQDLDKQIKVIIGTVKGDMHDIGKNLVIMMLKAKGYHVIDLGINVDAQDFVKAAVEEKTPYVCMSALLTTTMMYFKNVVDAFVEKGMRNKVVLLCGGAPVTAEFAQSVGCDYYANDALECANLVESLIQEK